MKTLIVCTSVSHGNTGKVAAVIGEILQARVIAPSEVDPALLASYDVVGFGSGIYLGSFHADLRDLVGSLPGEQRAKAFVFATSGFPDAGPTGFSRSLVRLLEEKGFDVLDTFSCRGLDTWFPFKAFGGLRKGRPDRSDLAAARSWAEGLRERAHLDQQDAG